MSKRYITLTMAFLAAFVFGLSLQSIPPVLPTLIREFALSHTQGGLLISLFALPGIFFSIPAGMLADIYGPRKVGLVSLLLIIVGTLIVVVGPHFAALAFGRFIAGVGATSMVIIGAQAISHAFVNDPKMGIAMGIFNAGVPAGTIFPHIVFSRLVLIWNWRITVLITVIICLVVLLLFFRYLENGTTSNGIKKAANSGRVDFLDSFRNMKSYWSIWLVAAAWMMYIAAKMSLFTFSPDYFLTIGYPYAIAGLLTSIFGMGSLVISPITGIMLGKTGKAERYLVFVGIVQAVLFMLLVTVAGGHLFVAIAIGMVAPLFPVAVFYLVPVLLPAEKFGLGYGILRICENIGLLMGPILFGLAYDLSSSYLPGFFLVSFLSLASAFAALMLVFFLKKSSNLKANI